MTLLVANKSEIILLDFYSSTPVTIMIIVIDFDLKYLTFIPSNE